MIKFADIHNHTGYSILDAAPSPLESVLRAKEIGRDSLAITDHGTISGWVQFNKACKDNGIKPLFGCLLKGQEIITLDGVKNIEDIKIGDYVLTHKGRYKKVINLFKREYSGNIFSIKLSNRHQRILKLTEEHPILVYNNNKIDWITPNNIIFGKLDNYYKNKMSAIKKWHSYVCFPKIKDINYEYINTKNYLPDFWNVTESCVYKTQKNNKYEELKKWETFGNKIKITEEFAYFLGLYCAEGSVRVINNILNGAFNLTFNILESEYANFVSNFLNKQFNIKCKLYYRHDKATIDCVSCNVPFAYLISGMCGIGAKNKHIPQEIMLSNEQIRLSFIKGLLDGDGGKITKENKRQLLRTSSKRLAWDVKTLFASIGHWSGVTAIKNGKYIAYDVEFNSYRKYARTLEDDDYIYKPILKIDKEFVTTQVYNFSVEEDNSYVSDFVLHNCESYIIPDLQQMRNEKIREKSHITILAQNEKGYRNILKLASLAFSKGFYYRQTLDKQMLFEHQEGLIVCSGCWTGFVQKALRENNTEEAIKIAQEFKSVFGDRYYLETQHFPLFKDTINGLEYVSAQLDLPIVLTCDPHYLTAELAETQEILHAIRDRRTFDEKQIIYGAYQWRSEELFEAVKILSPSSPWEKYFENTYNVSQRIENIPMLRGGSPKYNTNNSYELLKQWALDGFSRLGIKKEGIYKERFEKELDVISKYGFCDYILVIADIVKWAKSQNIWVGPGRGSAAGSLICYLTGITTVDPLKHDLIFERFINEGRKDSPPDVDVDFDMDRRDDVKEYISSKYGKDNVCNIGTFNFFKGRSALDDIRRIYELPTEEINEIKLEIPQYNESDERGNSTIKEMFQTSDKAKELLKKYPVLKKAEYIDGHIRQIGEHASGVVISNVPLTDIIAIYEREKDNKLTQFSCFDMNDSADLGLLKIDILGITELTVISDICKLIGMSLDSLYKIPIDDRETLVGFKNIDTDGIFQFSGYTTKRVLKQFRNINSFEQLVATVALSRPGPIQSGMTEKYTNGANGKIDNSYTWHKILREITKDSFNVIVYQEQIMSICNKLAGMSWADTDKIRKFMGKKYGDDSFEKYYIQFRDGCLKNGVTEKQARDLWTDIEKFGGYCFNKSHAVCYALVAFWGMYFKQHYPIQYYWARLSKEKDEEKIKEIAKGAIRKGLKVLKPKLGKSEMYWKIEDEKTLRAGLTYLKGIGEKAAEGLIKGDYKTEADFETKKYRAVTKRTLEILKQNDAFVKTEM